LRFDNIKRRKLNAKSPKRIRPKVRTKIHKRVRYKKR